MGKRKANGDDKAPTKDKMDVDNEDSGSESDTDMLNVDFEYFDPQPAVDFHGFKTLLRQLFDVDNQLFDLSELSDIEESDPETPKPTVKRPAAKTAVKPARKKAKEEHNVSARRDDRNLMINTAPSGYHQ